MGAVAEKLSYLADTKNLFKDRLNSLGAEILSTTTFRNYLNWLDEFYGKASDKTDLAKNGIVGKTSQESTTGKNVFKKANDLYNNMMDTGQFTLADMGNNVLKATKNTTGTTSPRFYITDSIVSSTTYYVSLDLLGNCNSLKVGIWIDGVGQTDLATITPTSNYQKISFSFTSNGDVARIYFRNTDENIEVGQYFQIKNVMISTSSDTTYEPYTGGEPSPSPDYPQEVNNLSGDVEYKVSGKNLFVGYNNMQVGFLPRLGNYPTTNSSYPNARYQLIELKQGESISTSGSTSALGRIRLIDKDTNKVTDTIIDTENDYYISTVNYASVFQIGTIRAKKDIILGILILSSVFDDNFQIEQGTTVTTYEPYIEPQTFNIPLKSKNLFDKDNANIINAGISAKVISTSQYNRLLYIPVKSSTTYTIQRRNDGDVNRFRVGSCTVIPENNVSVANAIEDDNATNITITTGANDKYLAVMYYRTYETVLTEQQILDSIQVEEGSTATTYEPYYDIELCNISDYKDRIYSQNGEFYLEKKTGKVVFDGSENWTINTSYTYNVFYRTLDNYARISNTQTTYCEYYKGIKNAGGIANFGNNYNNSIGVRTANDNIKDIYISNNSITSASDFKTWLSTHNTEVQYVLHTPTTTEITQENYPTLYSQLLAIQEFLTKYKINKEFLLDYSSPEIEY